MISLTLLMRIHHVFEGDEALLNISAYLVFS
jgi:hypothetical protein